MSFLNSVLSSIGAGAGTPSSNAARPASAGAPRTNSTPAGTTGPRADTAATGIKRKADESTNNPNKLARTASSTAATNGNPAKPRLPPAAAVTASKPGGNTVGQTSNQNKASTAPTQSKPAAKDSYREIMERALAAKATQTDFGKIKHKPTVRLTKREQRLAKEAAAAEKQNAGGGKSAAAKNRPGLPSRGSSGSVQAPVKEKKKPLELGYKGTMRPSRTLGPARKDASQPRAQHTHESYSDDDGEEDDCGSDESDMEAAGFDSLEQEEQASLQAARMEDLEAQRLENEHRRQKMEKKKALEQLVAARKKR